MRALFCLFFVLSVNLIEAKELRADISSEAAILVNMETGAVLFEKNIHALYNPASITKIATALYTLEKHGENLDVPVTASSNAVGAMAAVVRQAAPQKYPAWRQEFDGTHMGLKAGEILSLRDLLYGLMLVSGNDAANVIAEYSCGSIDTFVQELNGFLKSKGIKDTTFYNPHGLWYPGHMTTAADMAKIATLAMQNPTFREIVKTVVYPRPQTNKQEANFLLQGNRLLKKGVCYYPKAIGIKTGYVSKAGHTFVAAAEDNGRTLVVVLLKCSSQLQKFRDAIALFEAAFNEQLTTRILFNREYDHFSLSVRGGKTPLEAVLLEDLKIGFYPAEEPKFKAEIHWNKLKMPILANQHVGEIWIVSDKGAILKKAPLHALRDVPKTLMCKLTEFCYSLYFKILCILLIILTTSLAVFKTRKKAED